jgi:hypothetical protein
MATDEQMVQALRARGGPPKKAIFIGGGALLVLIVVGVVVSMRGGSDANKHWSSFSRCLIGPPVAPGENVFFRLREAELGSKGAPAAEGDAWPARCALHATSLYNSIEGTGESTLLKRLLSEGLGCAEGTPCKFPESGHVLGKADEIWKAAAVAKLELVDVPDVKMPEPRIKPEQGVGWPAIGEGTYSLVADRVTDKGELWLLFAPPRGDKKLPLRFCRIVDKGAKADCLDAKKVPEVGGKIELVDAAEPPAVSGLVSTDDGEEQKAFSLADGTEVKLRSGVRNGFSIEPRGKDAFLLAIQNGVAEQNKLPFPAETSAAEVGGWLAWFEMKKEDKEEVRKLALQKIGAGAKLEGEKVYLEGEIPARLEPCNGAIYGIGTSPPKLSVWFAEGSGWAKPVTGPLPTGERHEWASVCAPNSVSRFWVDKSAEPHKLGMLACTKGKACEKKEVEWKGVKAKRWLAVAALGDKVAVLYETFDDDKRLHFAPFAELATSSPTIITDSPEFSGEKFENPRVTITPEFVAVVFSSEKSLHGLYLNQAGHGPILAK